MKTKFTILLGVFACKIISQTITYSNFSAALTNTISVNIANNASFNSTLTTVTGSGVTWDASGLTQQAGTPTIHLSFNNPSSTPQGTLFPASNYVEYDPALASAISNNYFLYTADSVVKTGSYDPNGAHEIFQNYDKQLVFPFAYGQSFTDSYYKTNYSNATTISSYQSGTRTVSYNGYGTLILPQGSVSNVALISESRTNSLGPVSNYYTWYNVSNGKKLLYRSENNGSIITVWCSETVSGIHEKTNPVSVTLYPNPVQNISIIKLQSVIPLSNASLKIYNVLGAEIKVIPVKDQEAIIEKSGLDSGIMFYNLYNNDQLIYSGKLIIQ